MKNLPRFQGQDIIQRQVARKLCNIEKIWVRGHSRSMKMVSFDRHLIRLTVLYHFRVIKR